VAGCAEVAAGDLGGHDDGGNRVADRDELVNESFEFGGAGDGDFEDVAVLAGHPMALQDLGQLLGQGPGALEPLVAAYADPHECQGRPADPGQVDLGPVASDDAIALQARHAVSDRGRGEVNPAAKLGPADPPVALQLADTDWAECRIRMIMSKSARSWGPSSLVVTRGDRWRYGQVAGLMQIADSAAPDSRAARPLLSAQNFQVCAMHFDRGVYG
jgi:hypothetical protein